MNLVLRLCTQVTSQLTLRAGTPVQQFHARLLGQPLQEVHGGAYDGQSRIAMVTRMINDYHRMVLIAHKRFGNLGITDDVLDDLALVGYELSKQLRGAVVWDLPSGLGPPFDQLNESELRVLVELKSELSEKQLAVKLDLSPHTLHSHVKSIYRKVGVQGRLQLLFRLNAACNRLRMESHLPNMSSSL